MHQRMHLHKSKLQTYLERKRGLALGCRKGWGESNKQLLGEDGRSGLAPRAHTMIGVGWVYCELTSAVKEMRQDADSVAGAESWDEKIANVVDEAVAADPAALDGNDAIQTTRLISIQSCFDIESAKH